MSVVLIPGLDVEGEDRAEECKDCLPRLAQVHRSCEKEDFEAGITSVDSCNMSASHPPPCLAMRPTVVEELSQRSALMCPPCLRSIHGIEGLVKEEADSPRQIDPRRTVGVEARIVPKHGQDIDNHKTKAGKGNLSGGLALVDCRQQSTYKIRPARKVNKMVDYKSVDILTP